MRSSLAARLLAVLCVLLACSGASAESVEQVVNPKHASNTWASDMARVLGPGAEQKLNGLINGLERRTKVEMAVVTVQNTNRLEPKPFATALFNRWGIGQRSSDNGVLLLLVVEARRVEVETGSGMSAVLPDARAQSILNQSAVPRFKAGDYEDGVLASVREMARVIERSQGTLAGAPSATASKNSVKSRASASRPRPTAPHTSTPRPSSGSGSTREDAGSERTSSGLDWLPLAGGALLLPLGGWLAVRSKVRHCPRCKLKMKRLSEAEDDAHLLFDQKFEEDLGSVDYRAWKCDSCGAVTLERAVKWLSGYGDCSRCAHRTVSSQTTILRHPSYTHTGKSLTVRTCRFPRCGFRDQERRTLPKKHRTTSHSSSGFRSGGGSSSSGSFGGGSSSGGGAGASW